MVLEVTGTCVLDASVEGMYMNRHGRTWSMGDDLDTMFATAEQQAAACLAGGNRYWETTVDKVATLLVSHWVDSLPCHTPCRRARILEHSTQLANDGLLVAVCVPSSCSSAELDAVVMPSYIAWFMTSRLFDDVDAVAALPPWPGMFRSEELSSWSHFSLDFVVAGVNTCGTTSLRRNLGRHAEINFSKALPHGQAEHFVGSTRTDLDEDAFFGELGFHVLPTKEKVDSFNARRFEGRHPARLFGLYQPDTYANHRVMHQLSLIPNLRVVLSVCDVINRLDKMFFKMHWPCRTHRGPECLKSLSRALARPEDERSFQVYIGESLETAERIFGPRLFVLHLNQIRAAPRRTYNEIVTFLGAHYFSARMKFYRYNSMSGPRTGICGNLSSLRYMRRKLARDYSAVEQALFRNGQPLPDELTTRRSRCEDPQLLSHRGADCPGKSRCTGV